MRTTSGLEHAAALSHAETAASDHLRTFLAGRDVACPACGYNLRDLGAARCPECGEELVLQVGLAEPRQAALIAGLIGLAAGAGLNGLLLGYFVIRQALMGDIYIGAPFFAVNVWGLLVEATALILWLRFWRVVRRRSRAAKVVFVAGCWMLTLVNLLIFSVLIR